MIKRILGTCSKCGDNFVGYYDDSEESSWYDGNPLDYPLIQGCETCDFEEILAAEEARVREAGAER